MIPYVLAAEWKKRLRVSFIGLKCDTLAANSGLIGLGFYDWDLRGPLVVQKKSVDSENVEGEIFRIGISYFIYIYTRIKLLCWFIIL